MSTPCPPHFLGRDTGPGVKGDVQRYLGLQEQPHRGFWDQEGLGSSPNVSFPSLSFLLSEMG